jgi:hypothetical protein
MRRASGAEVELHFTGVIEEHVLTRSPSSRLRLVGTFARGARRFGPTTDPFVVRQALSAGPPDLS